jgi:hypothetical protein
MLHVAALVQEPALGWKNTGQCTVKLPKSCWHQSHLSMSIPSKSLPQSMNTICKHWGAGKGKLMPGDDMTLANWQEIQLRSPNTPYPHHQLPQGSWARYPIRLHLVDWKTQSQRGRGHKSLWRAQENLQSFNVKFVFVTVKNAM